MHFITLLLCIAASIYAIPYGIWEYKNTNKIGGVICVFISVLCVGLAISNFWIE